MSRILLAHESSPDKFSTFDREIVTELSPTDILYYSDAFSRTALNQAIDRFGAPAGVIMDQESSIIPQQIPSYFIPCLHPASLPQLLQPIKSTLTDDLPLTTHCFNFGINRKTLDRYLLLKLVGWFKLDCYLHTWSGKGASTNCEYLIQEMNQLECDWLTLEFRNHLLTRVSNITHRWHDSPEPVKNKFNAKFGDVSLPTSRKFNGSIISRWPKIHKQDYLNTAVSLLTENSSNNEPNFTWTEKTYWAMLGLTFSIWVGNYGQAQQMKHMGFDVFEDVVNHRYQYCNTLLERCYYALADNIELLTDLDKCKKLRALHHDRLLANREHLLKIPLNGWEIDEIQRLPAWAQTVVCDIPWVKSRLQPTNT
jgi:hypothetical protein